MHTTLSPDGMQTAVVDSPDPRFGMQSTWSNTTTVSSPAGKLMVVARTRTATMDAGKNLVSQVDTTTFNGKATTSSWDAASRTMTTVSPEGRQSMTTFD